MSYIIQSERLKKICSLCDKYNFEYKATIFAVYLENIKIHSNMTCVFSNKKRHRYYEEDKFLGYIESLFKNRKNLEKKALEFFMGYSLKFRNGFDGCLKVFIMEDLWFYITDSETNLSRKIISVKHINSEYVKETVDAYIKNEMEFNRAKQRYKDNKEKHFLSHKDIELDLKLSKFI